MVTKCFKIVAKALMWIASKAGTTYNEVNIIVYYLLIPLSWMAMVDYIVGMPLLSLLFILGWGVFLWLDPMGFRERCDWAFKKSVDFLLLFRSIGWNYVVSSVIICVGLPILVYMGLLYLIMT